MGKSTGDYTPTPEARLSPHADALASAYVNRTSFACWILDPSEGECLDYFPALRAAIEMILDQKIAAERERKQTAAATREIDNFIAAIKKR